MKVSNFRFGTSTTVLFTTTRYSFFFFFSELFGASLGHQVGQPHQWALDEQKRLIKEKAEAAKEKGLSFTSGQQDRKEGKMGRAGAAHKGPHDRLTGGGNAAFWFKKFASNLLDLTPNIPLNCNLDLPTWFPEQGQDSRIELRFGRKIRKLQIFVQVVRIKLKSGLSLIYVNIYIYMTSCQK